MYGGLFVDLRSLLINAAFGIAVGSVCGLATLAFRRRLNELVEQFEETVGGGGHGRLQFSLRGLLALSSLAALAAAGAHYALAGHPAVLGIICSLPCSRDWRRRTPSSSTHGRRALSAEQRLTSQMGPLLLGLVRARAYRRYGCTSLGAFAREWLGMSPSKADSLVRLERACEIALPLRTAYRAGRLSWAQALLLVPLLRREDAVRWQAAWVARAERVSVRRLGDEVSRALALGSFVPTPLDPPHGRWPDGSDGADDPEVSPAADSQTRAHPSDFLKTMAFFFTAPRDVARLFRGALATVQRRIERRQGRTSCESKALDVILEHAFETWGLANERFRREHRVFARDGWRCSARGARSERTRLDALASPCAHRR